MAEPSWRTALSFFIFRNFETKASLACKQPITRRLIKKEISFEIESDITLQSFRTDRRKFVIYS